MAGAIINKAELGPTIRCARCAPLRKAVLDRMVFIQAMLCPGNPRYLVMIFEVFRGIYGPLLVPLIANGCVCRFGGLRPPTDGEPKRRR